MHPKWWLMEAADWKGGEIQSLQKHNLWEFFNATCKVLRSHFPLPASAVWHHKHPQTPLTPILKPLKTNQEFPTASTPQICGIPFYIFIEPRARHSLTNIPPYFICTRPLIKSPKLIPLYLSNTPHFTWPSSTAHSAPSHHTQSLPLILNHLQLLPLGFCSLPLLMLPSGHENVSLLDYLNVHKAVCKLLCYTKLSQD